MCLLIMGKYFTKTPRTEKALENRGIRTQHVVKF